MRKDALLAFLMNQTDFFDPENVSEVFTARYLAQRFNMQRNTASHYLNQLVAQGVLCKINTRPVYFLHKQAFSQQFFTLSRNEYASVAELLAHGEQECAPDDHFSLLIGHNESLKRPIEQLKTALFYPDGGLPLLMTGESGTGKSYLAQLMHEYAIAQALLSPDAPFISFNCAQYASNPELLAANLFGYVKGAFTGAQSDRPGAFEAADGGMLFLDEVHRLSAEGQEKLFTLADCGEIYRVGDTAQGASGFGTFGICDDRRDTQYLSDDIFAAHPDSGQPAGSPAPQPPGKRGADLTVFLDGGEKTLGHAYPQTAFVADPQSVCLSRQRRRTEKCGEVCGGDGMGEKAWAGNRYRVAARFAGCHAVGIAVTK